MFEYKKGITTSDDIIEHILFRLNDDYEGACLTITDFCYNKDKESRDYNMSMIVMDKMFEHNIAKQCSGQGNQDYDIELTSTGVQIYESGGWKRYIKEYNDAKFNAKKQEDSSKIWSIRSNKATVFTTLFGVICFCWGYYESHENKKKDVQMKKLQDSLTIIKTNNQIVLQSIVPDSSQRQFLKQKYDSLKRSKK